MECQLVQMRFVSRSYQKTPGERKRDGAITYVEHPAEFIQNFHET